MIQKVKIKSVNQSWHAFIQDSSYQSNGVFHLIYIISSIINVNGTISLDFRCQFLKLYLTFLRTLRLWFPLWNWKCQSEFRCDIIQEMIYYLLSFTINKLIWPFSSLLFIQCKLGIRSLNDETQIPEVHLAYNTIISIWTGRKKDQPTKLTGETNLETSK